ncbi:cell division control protein 45 [Fistulifera solaris]|uniref:Cell division control protein 45 n=1 Tax=Fistulifera solaris TaxID=1519565 RepID=A0A1Z5KT60_FISSO|nr:cell division control protein 45 [Fistulifera solaris]|eukprot:GAX29503.1 cell division control protein 45 [Fistulifera solaris]
MKLEIEYWHRGYQQILRDCGQDGSVWILCRPTVDALCAARILSFLLRADHVAHHLQCCTNLEEDLKQASAVATCVVLLHMGAPQNLTKWYQGRQIYVLDPARPVHLANIHANRDIVVFWDIDETEIPSDGENLSGNESSESEDDDESSEEDEPSVASSDHDEGEFEYQDENDENAGDPQQHREENQDDSDDDDDSSVARTKKPRREDEEESHEQERDTDTMEETEPTTEPTAESTSSLLTPRQWQQDRRQRIERYYSAGSYYGAPAAFVAYQLATQLRFGDHTTLLWLACVGVTDAYWHGRLDLTGYSTLALQLRQACQKLDADDSDDIAMRARNTVYAEQLSSSGATGERTKLSLRGTGRVFSQPDYKFFLLRFSSLLDAMMYSDTVSTQLQLYRPAGMNKLKELLAKMGFPLTECQQPYAFMKPALRRMLASKLQEYAEEYGLENLEYTSFLRITGYQSVLSAADAAHAAAALLDFGSDKDDMFNRALDALQSNAPPRVMDLQNEDNLVNGGSLTGNPLGYGLHLAMKLQKKIFAAAASLMERNAITSLAHFRYAYVGDEPVLAKPAVLTRLAQYLFQLHRVNGKWVGRPLILLAKDDDFYTVAGYEYTEKAGDWVRNRWGQHFALAAQSMTGTFSFGHDSHVIRVGSDDVQRFLEQLHYLMDSA